METDKVLQAPRKPESIRPEGAKTTLKLMRQKYENLYHLYPESGYWSIPWVVMLPPVKKFKLWFAANKQYLIILIFFIPS